MPRTPAGPIRFEAPVLRPERPARAAWTFLRLPPEASARLPSRGQVSVDARVDGHPVQTTLSPDGAGGHWMTLDAALMAAIGASVGAVVGVQLQPVDSEPEPSVPADLRRALAAVPAARAQWDDITPVARRDFIQWIETAKKAATRERRIANACDMLASGKRRVCCFDRSGIYGKGMSAPKAAAGPRGAGGPGRA